MRLRIPLFLLINVLLFSSSLPGQTAITTKQRLQLDSISKQDVPKGAPGIATAIIKDGTTLYERCYGFADLSDSSIITTQTRFNLASNAKQFTALAILLLIDAKRIGLTDDIRKFFPSLYPGIKSKLSISNLLNHSSGIRDVYDLWSLQGLTWWKSSFGNKDVLALIQQQDALNFPPGSQQLYSNTNYILLALIIEKVTGRSFVEFTNEMFNRLNMPNTSFEDHHEKIRGQIGRAYFNFDSWRTYSWIWDVCGDGNLFSTLEDQIHWEQIVQGKVCNLVKREIIEKSQQLIPGAPNTNYGYGLEFGKYKGFDYRFHEGATGAWKATVIRFTAENISMITLTNTGKSVPSLQTRQMADVLLDVKQESTRFPTKPAKAGKFIAEEELLGIYSSDEAFMFQFEQRDGKLFLKRQARNDIELNRESGNVFHQQADPAFKQEFKLDVNGNMEVTAYYTTHPPYTLTRISTSWEHVDYHLPEGKYLNAETNTFLDIHYIKDKNYDVRIGTQDSTKGLLITPGKLVVDNYTIFLDMKKPVVDCIYLDGDRIKKIRFDRVR